MALEKRLSVIALTDHDSLEGITPAIQAAAGRLRIISGVELSAEDADTDRHILGYGVSTAPDTRLSRMCVALRQARVTRLQRMIEKLAALGVNVPLADVLALADQGSVGRPHLARVMLRLGYVQNIQEAFDRYIGDHRVAYEPHHPLAPADAIQMIHEAGGVAVLAHPGCYPHPERIIEALIPAGLDGVEVYYPEHTPSVVKKLRAFCQRHGLLMTAGSDFHRREGDSSTRIGTVAFPTSYDPVAALDSCADKYRVG